MQKKITILCSSFPPETGAAPGRMGHLAELLQQEGFAVTVIAAMPNYPTGRIFRGYRGKLWHKDIWKGIPVYRHWLIPSHSNNRLHRVISLLSYTLSLFLLVLPRLVRLRPQLLILSSPPFVTGYCGLLLARLIRSRTLLNISDIWPGSALELGFIQEGYLYRFLQKRERSMYRRASGFSVQSEEIAAHIRSSEPYKKIFLYRNLPEAQAQAAQERPAGKRKIVYAGLLGIAQGVYDICRYIDFAALGTELHIYGAGKEQEQISHFIAGNPCRGIFYHGSFPAETMPDLLSGYHAMLVPLRTQLQGAVPSKIFNAMGNGLPLLFCGGGEAAAIIRETDTGFASPSGDYTGLQQNIQQLLALDQAAYEQLRDNCRRCMEGRFNRRIQDRLFLDFLQQL